MGRIAALSPTKSFTLLEGTGLQMTNTSHIAETNDDDMSIKSSKQQSSSGKHSSKVSADKSHTGNISSSDHSTSEARLVCPKRLQSASPLTKANISASTRITSQSIPARRRTRSINTQMMKILVCPNITILSTKCELSNAHSSCLHRNTFRLSYSGYSETKDLLVCSS